MPKIPLRTAFALLFWESVFASSYEAWVAPVFISGLAGELGIPVTVVAVLSAMPFVGSIGQLLGLWAFGRVESAKRYTTTVATVARGLWLVPLACALHWSWRSWAFQETFPVLTWFKVVVPVICVASLLLSSSTASWNCWMRGLIPAYLRGRFFGTRSTFAMATLLAANFLAASVVGWRPGGYWLGYAILGFGVIVSTIFSGLLLSRIPEGKSLGSMRIQRIPEKIAESLRDPEFSRVLLLGAGFNFAIQLSSPYFPYFFTRNLGFNMTTVAGWTVFGNIGMLASAALWGRHADKLGDSRVFIRVCAALLALPPFFYATVGPSLLVWLAPAEHFVSGVTWCGYALGMTLLLFRACPKDGSAVVHFSVYSAANGIAGALGVLIGGRLIEWLAPLGGFRGLFLLTGIVRLTFALFVFERLLRPLSGRYRLEPSASPARAP